MDTLSTSLTPNFQLTKPINPTNHHNLRPPPHHHHPTTFITTTAPPLYKTKPPTSFPQKDHFTPLHPPPYPLPPSRSSIHRRATSGYAAALLDIAQSNDVVLTVAKDVRRLLKILRHGYVLEFLKDELIEEREKGDVLNELMMKGKFNGYLIGLIKIVIDKGKMVNFVMDVLEEFDHIFYQLTPFAHAPPPPPMGIN